MADTSAEQNAVLELKPLNLADLLDAVWRLYRRHFGELIRIGAVVYVPLGVLHILSAALMFQGYDVEGGAPTLPGFGLVGLGAMVVVGLLFWLSMPIMQAAMAKAVAEFYLGRQATVGSAYRFALHRLWHLLFVAILTALINLGLLAVCLVPLGIAGGALVMMDPGETVSMVVFGIVAVVVGLVAIHVSIAVTIKLLFAALAVVLEDATPVAALRRSWDLTTNHFWRILVALLILWLLVTILTGIIVWPAQLATVFTEEMSLSLMQGVLNGLSALAQLLFQPVQIVGTVLIYYDLRMRKEGFDLVMMADAIGEPQLATRARTGEARPAALYEAPPPAASEGEVERDTASVPASAEPSQPQAPGADETPVSRDAAEIAAPPEIADLPPAPDEESNEPSDTDPPART